jgi:hypothetical protein
LKYLESYRAVECDQSTILGLQLMFHSKYTGCRIDTLLHPWTLCLLRRDLLYFRTLDILCGSDGWCWVWLPPVWKHLRFVFPLCPNVWLSLIRVMHHHLEPVAGVRLCVVWLILCSSPIDLRIYLPYLRLQHPLIHGLCHQTVTQVFLLCCLQRVLDVELRPGFDLWVLWPIPLTYKIRTIWGWVPLAEITHVVLVMN